MTTMSGDASWRGGASSGPTAGFRPSAPSDMVMLVEVEVIVEVDEVEPGGLSEDKNDRQGEKRTERSRSTTAREPRRPSNRDGPERRSAWGRGRTYSKRDHRARRKRPMGWIPQTAVESVKLRRRVPRATGTIPESPGSVSLPWLPRLSRLLPLPGTMFLNWFRNRRRAAILSGAVSRGMGGDPGAAVCGTSRPSLQRCSPRCGG